MTHSKTGPMPTGFATLNGLFSLPIVRHRFTWSWGDVHLTVNRANNPVALSIEWHAKKTSYKSKLAAYGQARQTGITANADPGLGHVTALSKLLRRAPKRYDDDEGAICYVREREGIALRFHAGSCSCPPMLVLPDKNMTGATERLIPLGYCTAQGIEARGKDIKVPVPPADAYGEPIEDFDQRRASLRVVH